MIFLAAIGTVVNTKSSFTCGGTSIRELTVFSTIGVLSDAEMRDFYVSFEDNLLKVGRVGKAEPFISHLMTCPVMPTYYKYIGITSGYGTNADWVFCGFGKCCGMNLKLFIFFSNSITMAINTIKRSVHRNF